MPTRRSTICLVLVLTILSLAAASHAQTSAFTYQGKLTDTGGNASSYDFTFKLFDAVGPAPSGSQIGSDVMVTGVTVTNGIFTVNLDFGSAAFSGPTRFLDISAKRSTDPTYTLLTPRQPLTSAPYSIKSNNADTATNATTATNSTQLGGVAANQYVVTTDSRMSDARNPLPGSGSYIQSNPAIAQSTSSFDVNNGRFNGNLRIEGNGLANPTDSSLSISSNGSFLIDAPFNAGGRMTVLPNGNVGIGNTNPLHKLDVSGSAQINNDLNVNGVISGDGSGLTLGQRINSFTASSVANVPPGGVQQFNFVGINNTGSTLTLLTVRAAARAGTPSGFYQFTASLLVNGVTVDSQTFIVTEGMLTNVSFSTPVTLNPGPNTISTSFANAVGSPGVITFGGSGNDAIRVSALTVKQ